MSRLSVDLLWHARYRGLLPVGPHALDPDGRAALACPHPEERRSYLLPVLDRAGQEVASSRVSVQTIYRWELSPGAAYSLGITGNDLYLFRDGKKSRVLADARGGFTDLALAAAAGTYLLAVIDTLVETHSVVFGHVENGVQWSRTLPAPVSCVAVDREGAHPCVALEAGRLLSLGRGGETHWEAVQEEPLTALARPPASWTAVAGTAEGTVIALDSEGGFRWRSPVGLPVRALTVDGAGDRVAAGVSDGQRHQLLLLGADGTPVWEHTLEHAPTGLSLTPDGHLLLLSCADGGAWCFELEHQAAAGGGAGSRVDHELELARRHAAAGEWPAALELFRRAAGWAPDRFDVVAAWEAAEAAFRFRQLEQIRGLLPDHPDWALARLDDFARQRPWDPAALEQGAPLRRQAIDTLLAAAERAVAGRDWEGAAHSLQAVLAAEPFREAVRRRLAAVRRDHSAALAADAEAHWSRQDAEAALALWRRSQELCPSAEVEARIREAELARALELGTAHYEAGRMPEAAFQFRKVLALDPDHPIARKYLGFAGSAPQDTQLADRFSHLE